MSMPETPVGTPPDCDTFAIRFQEVHKSFGKHHILKGLDIAIPKGWCTVIIGRSGTGKSVTLKHAMGLMRPDSGNIFVDDQDLTKMSDAQLRHLRLRFGMVFQHAALFDSMSVYENIAFPLHEHTDLGDKAVRARVEEVLEQVSLSEAIDKMPAELSGGMKKRVGLARALAHTPDILLYDEPTTGLDPILCAQIDELIRVTQERNAGMTSVVVSHDMKGAFHVADHIYMVHEGRVVAQGPADFFRRTDHPMIRQFVEGRLDGPFSVK